MDELKDQEVSINFLRDQKVFIDELKIEGVSTDDLKSQGVSIEEVKSKGVSADKQRVSIDKLKDQPEYLYSQEQVQLYIKVRSSQ